MLTSTQAADEPKSTPHRSPLPQVRDEDVLLTMAGVVVRLGR